MLTLSVDLLNGFVCITLMLIKMKLILAFSRASGDSMWLIWYIYNRNGSMWLCAKCLYYTYVGIIFVDAVWTLLCGFSLLHIVWSDRAERLWCASVVTGYIKKFHFRFLSLHRRWWYFNDFNRFLNILFFVCFILQAKILQNSQAWLGAAAAASSTSQLGNMSGKYFRKNLHPIIVGVRKALIDR